MKDFLSKSHTKVAVFSIISLVFLILLIEPNLLMEFKIILGLLYTIYLAITFKGVIRNFILYLFILLGSVVSSSLMFLNFANTRGVVLSLIPAALFIYVNVFIVFELAKTKTQRLLKTFIYNLIYLFLIFTVLHFFNINVFILVVILGIYLSIIYISETILNR